MSAPNLDSFTSQRAAAIAARIERLFAEGAATGATAGFYVPGRIEIVGKHTDYAGGSSITCAAPQGLVALVRPRTDDQITVTSGGETRVTRASVNASVPRGDWGGYVAAVVRRLSSNFPGVRFGADLVLDSDLPRASGMSSSSALVTAVFLGLRSVMSDRSGLDALVPDRAATAGYLAAIENGSRFGALPGEPGVGTKGGSEDHVAILLSEAGRLKRYSYAPFVEEGGWDLPSGWTLVVGSSGVVAAKTGAALAAYNAASRLASDAALFAGVERLAQVQDRDRFEAAIVWHQEEAALRARFEHFRIEQYEVLPAVSAALASGSIAELGRAVDLSQRAADNLLGNQVPETRYLAAEARRLGAAAASSFGAGFGGSVWALVPAGDALAFIETWRAGYRTKYPNPSERAEFFEASPGPGVVKLF